MRALRLPLSRGAFMFTLTLMNRLYSGACMRWISTIVIIVIGTMLTPAPAMYARAGQATVSIQALDVCNGSATGITVDQPNSIPACSCNLLPPLMAGVGHLADAPFKPLLLSCQDERPPRA